MGFYRRFDSNCHLVTAPMLLSYSTDFIEHEVMPQLNAQQQWNHFYRTADRAGSFPDYSYEERIDFLSFSRKLQAGEKIRVLDVGCGTGRISNMLRTGGGHFVVGIDPCEEVAREALSQGRLSEAHVGLIQSSQLESNQFDLVICWGVLCVVQDLNAALSEIARIASNGAEVLIHDYHSRNPYAWYYAHRPKWVDRLLHRVAIPLQVHPLNENIIARCSPTSIIWDNPAYRVQFSHHSDKRIEVFHNVLRSTFQLLKQVTHASWCSNRIILRGQVTK